MEIVGVGKIVLNHFGGGVIDYLDGNFWGEWIFTSLESGSEIVELGRRFGNQ